MYSALSLTQVSERFGALEMIKQIIICPREDESNIRVCVCVCVCNLVLDFFAPVVFTAIFFHFRCNRCLIIYIMLLLLLLLFY